MPRCKYLPLTVVVTVLTGWSVCASAQFVEDRFETITTVRASEILPGSLYRSSAYQVSEEVRVDQNAYIFTVETDGGLFPVVSRRLLDIRLFETEVVAQAVAQFRKKNKKLATELKGVLEVRENRLGDILTSPLKTASNLAGQLGRNVAETLGDKSTKRKGKATEQPLYRDRDPIVAAHRRTVASQLRLDVYSTNPSVQAFLDAAAKAREGGDVSAGGALITVAQPPTVRVAGGRLDGEVESLVRRLRPSELNAAVYAELGALGVRPAAADRFMSNPNLSPRHRLVLAAHLDALGDIPGRELLASLTATASSEPEALAYLDMVRMYAILSERDSPIRRFSGGAGVPLAVLADGRVALALGVDLAFWNEDTSRLTTWLAQKSKTDGARGAVLMLSGAATPRAAGAITGRGIDLKEQYLVPK
jgi:hypothetical protein